MYYDEAYRIKPTEAMKGVVYIDDMRMKEQWKRKLTSGVWRHVASRCKCLLFMFRTGALTASEHLRLALPFPSMPLHPPFSVTDPLHTTFRE